MDKQASVLENETHKLHWDFDIQTDNLISATRLPKKRELAELLDFSVPADQRVKLKESEKKDKYLAFAREFLNLGYERHDYTNCNCCYWYSHQRVNTRSGGLGNNRIIGDHPNCYIIEKSPGELSWLAVPQSPVKDH